jgi:hypothetical protein
MRTKFLIFGMLLVLINACDKKDEVLNSDLFKVSGTVFQNGVPAQNVQVSIDSALNYTVFTNENGEFQILDVSKGKHVIEIFKVSNNLKSSSMITDDKEGYSISSYDIDVNTDVSLEALKLPRPVKIDTIVQLNSKSIEIIWNSTDAQDFREYKIYKHSTSGLDESTGELVHISTEINDTTFVFENISAYETYFFRIYIMNEYGKLGGSNIAFIETQNLNLFNDGDFETELALGYWNLSESSDTYLDSEIKHDGNYSLHLLRDTTDGFSSRKITHQRFSDLVIGEEYTFSFWFRVMGVASECSDVIVDFDDLFQWSEEYPFCDIGFKAEEWCYWEITFESLKENFSLYIYFDTFSDIWIDNLILKRKEYIE